MTKLLNWGADFFGIEKKTKGFKKNAEIPKVIKKLSQYKCRNEDIS